VVAGSKVPGGTTVELVPSDGPQPRTVPKMVGVTLSKARALLTGLQLELSVASTPVFHPTAKVGTIAVVAPAAGQQVARGSTVVVTLSKGPDLVEVPSPDGVAPMKFVASLLDAGFKVGKITGRPRWVIPALSSKGKPVKAGDKILRGSVIDIAYPKR
jgi:serine/threonine-protein kinase